MYLYLIAQAGTPESQLLKSLEQMRDPVSHSAVIAGFGLIVIATLLWFIRQKAADNRYMMEKVVQVTSQSALALNQNTTAFIELREAIDKLREKEREIICEQRELAKMTAAHPCILLSSKYRDKVIALINKSYDEAERKLQLEELKPGDCAIGPSLSQTS